MGWVQQKVMPSRTAKIRERQELERRLAQQALAWYIYATAPFYIFEEWDFLLFEHLEALYRGDITRLMCFLSPRAGKSEKISVRFPAWAIGNRPSTDLMQVSYAQDLAAGFGRQVRDQIMDPDYRALFPGVGIREDLRGAKHWEIENPDKTQKPGVYWSAGITSGIAGKGWTLGVIDDPLSEQDMFSNAAADMVNKWYGPGFYTRRQASAVTMIGIVQTRWMHNDLAGFLLKQAAGGGEFADKWTQVKIPAIVDQITADKLNKYSALAQHMNQLRENQRAAIYNETPKPQPRYNYEQGQSYAPRRWPLPELMRQKHGSTMSARSWNALYMQEPSDDEGNIIARKHWKPWNSAMPPPCDFLMACYDTAFEEDEQADYSARTTWGVFRDANDVVHGILLEAWRGKVDFPELKKEVIQHHKHYHPDKVFVEKRGSGISLIQELRRTEVPVQAWLPPGATSGGTKGARARSKIPRTHSCTGMFESGRIHYMANDENIEQVINETAVFPHGDSDDWHDTVTMAVLKLRISYSVGTDEDRDDDDDDNDEPRIITKRHLRLVHSGT